MPSKPRWHASSRPAWDKQKEITNKHYEPGKFTTLIAFEWTSIPYGQNLHRNVFFRDDKGPDVVFSTLDSDKAEDLWTYLEVQRKMGFENFAIPHNGRPGAYKRNDGRSGRHARRI